MAQEGQTRAWALFSTHSCGHDKVTPSEHLLFYSSISGIMILASLEWNKLCYVHFLQGTYALYLFLSPHYSPTKGKVKPLRIGALLSYSLLCSMAQHTPGTGSITLISHSLSSYIPLTSQNQHTPKKQLDISSLDLTNELNKYLLSANYKPSTGLRVGTGKW